MKKIVKGNDFTLRIPVMKQVEGQKVPFPLPACTDVQVRVCNQFKRISLSYDVDVENDNIILARVEGDQIPLGTYAIEVRGKILGNDWRSEEYPQFEIVARNADADLEFGETDEGDNSVEMDTALVILPPSVDLQNLITKAEEAIADTKKAIEDVKDASSSIDGSEAERAKAEKVREDNESARAKAEKLRADAELDRVSNESQRKSREDTRNSAEDTRLKAEVERNSREEHRASDEQERVSNESARKSAETIRISNEEARDSSEGERVKAEAARSKAEKERVGEEDVRIESEKKRVGAEQSRVDAEGKRVLAEEARVLAEKKRESDFAAIKSECETATDNANTATGNTNEAIRKCETATAGAERCNVTLDGTKIIVTNREGEKQETEVVNTEEVVTVVITSSVESISVAGLKVNVFLNNGKTPQTYTTDSEGKTTFKVSRGVYYQVAVPEYANAQPLSPIGFTSVGVSKTITFNYEPYDEETSEKVIVTVTKYTDGTGAPWEGKEVIVTIDNKATTYTTDEKGQATIYVPYLKEYTVRVDDEDGYYVRFNKNSRTYTSRVAQRLIQVNMYQFKTGIYVLDSDATEYYIDDWVAAGKTAEEAIAIKVADQKLRLNRGTFVIRCNDLKDMTKLQKYQWCTQNLQFTSIALNGNTSSDPNYWNGEQSSFLVRQEAEERSLSVPAFAFAYGQSLEIGGEKLNGFLMSVGQEYVHISNAGTIREVLRTLFGDSVADAYYKFVNGQTRWTSTQYNATNAWFFNSQAYVSSKNYSYYVLPVFAC
jgi:hypothetical protein